MLKTHLIIAWRNIWKNKLLSIINIWGFAIGIGTCLIIALYVADEYSFDRHHQHADRIVRVILKGKVGDEIISEAVTPAPIAQTLKAEFPEVEAGTRLRDFGTPKVSFGNISYRNSKIAFVDPNFLQVFTLPMVKGDPINALKEPNSIIITETEAAKYFGDQDPLGQVLKFDEWNDQYKVTGIIENIPANSHFQFDFFASMVGLKDQKEFEWVQSLGYNYLLLREGSDPVTLESKLPEIVKKYMGPQIQISLGLSHEEFIEKGNHVGLFLQPLTDIHLRTDYTLKAELEEGGSAKTVNILIAVAVFMLVIACINFMNLSTSLATKRAKEVGIKKVLGGRRSQLIIQFLTESSVIALLSAILAMVLVYLALPWFSALSGKVLQAGQLFSSRALIYLVALVLFTGLLAGLYPALILSIFKPVTALKGRFSGTGNRWNMRSGLVIFQFAISVILIIATLIADLQMSFILNKDLGYDKDRLLVIRNSWMLGDKELVLKEQLQADSRVASIARSGFLPAGETNSTMYTIRPDRHSDSFRRTNLYYVDHQYLETMGMRLIAGTNFDQDDAADSSNVIINQTAVGIFGLKNDAVGQVISLQTDLQGGRRDLKVIGVVEDFHFESLYQPVEPLIMFNQPSSGLIIRAANSDMSELIAQVETLWKKLKPDEPFSYSILDQSYRETYLAEINLKNVLRAFTLLTLMVAFIGLFGLVTFTIERKVKEIGIRKVLGSSVLEIVNMLSKEFLMLIGISFLAAFPLGFYLTKQWLQDFTYRIDIPWWVFLAAALSTLIMALVTISLKSIKAALANPVEALRNE